MKFTTRIRSGPSRTRGAWLALFITLAIVAQFAKASQRFVIATFWLNLAAVIGLAAVLSRPASSEEEPVSTLVTPVRGSRSWRIGATLAGLGGILSVACSLWLVIDWAGALFRVLLLGPVALACLAVGLDLLAGFRPRWPLRRDSLGAFVRRREVQAVAAMVLVGLFFRFCSIGFFPPVDGFASIEETQRGTGARLILESGARPWEWPLSQYVAAAAFSMFGYSIHALRVPTTLLGCLTLIPFYLLLREMTAPPPALFATALLSVARWHVQVSWYNEDVYVPLFFFVTVLYLLLRTCREHRPLCYVILGACCGYTLYDYAGFRITPVIALAFFAGEAVRRRRLPADWPHIALMSAVVVVFAIPLIGLLAHHDPEAYFEAFQRSLANKDYYSSDVHSFLSQRTRRINAASDMFTLSDHGAFLQTLNTRQAPLLDPFTSVAFVLGFGTTIVHLRRRHHLFFVLTFLFLALVSTTVVQNLDFRRLSILVPFVFVFIALLTDKLDGWAGGVGCGRFVRLGLALVALLAGAWNYFFLFRVLAVDHQVRGSHRDEYSTPAFYLHEHYQNEWVLLLTPIVQNFFLPNDYDWIKPPGLQGDYALRVEAVLPFERTPPPDRDVLLLIERPFDIAAVMERVRDLYSGSSCELRRDPDDSRWDLGVCRIPAAVKPHPPPPSASSAHRDAARFMSLS